MTDQSETQGARDAFVDVLRSRRMLKPGEEWVIDVNLARYAREVVAATLRTAAEQVSGDQDRGELLATAEKVENGEHDDCCPLCQEVTCDEGCALAAARALEGIQP